MGKLTIYILLAIFLLPSCSNKSTGTTAVVKPKHHHSWFNKKNDKKKKRTKVVRMKN